MLGDESGVWCVASIQMKMELLGGKNNKFITMKNWEGGRGCWQVIQKLFLSSLFVFFPSKLADNKWKRRVPFGVWRVYREELQPFGGVYSWNSWHHINEVGRQNAVDKMETREQQPGKESIAHRYQEGKSKSFLSTSRESIDIETGTVGL